MPLVYAHGDVETKAHAAFVNALLHLAMRKLSGNEDYNLKVV